MNRIVVVVLSGTKAQPNQAQTVHVPRDRLEVNRLAYGCQVVLHAELLATR